MFASFATIYNLASALIAGVREWSTGGRFILTSADSHGAGQVVEKVAGITGIDSSLLGQYFESARAFIVEHFGESGLYAAYITTAAIVVFVLSKLFKISFSILKLVVVPSVALAFVATFFLPYNFFYFLPVTVSLFSVLLLFRG